MKKLVSLSLLLVCFIGLTSAAQPRITKLSDNFGNTYELEADKDDAMQYVYPQKNLTVTEDMDVTLCVDEVYSEEDDELLFTFATSQELERVKDTTDRCHTWQTGKEDFQSYWQFEAQVRDKDGVRYVNDVDHVVQVRWRSEKLKLAGDTDERTTKSYDNVLLSQSEYQELKSDSSEPQIPEDKKLVNREEWNDTKEQLENKNQRINELQQRISELEQQVEELTSHINQSEAEEGNISGSLEGVPANQGNNGEDLPGNQQAEENRPGFVNSLLGSIFG